MKQSDEREPPVPSSSSSIEEPIMEQSPRGESAETAEEEEEVFTTIDDCNREIIHVFDSRVLAETKEKIAENAMKLSAPLKTRKKRKPSTKKLSPSKSKKTSKVSGTRLTEEELERKYDDDDIRSSATIA